MRVRAGQGGEARACACMQRSDRAISFSLTKGETHGSIQIASVTLAKKTRLYTVNRERDPLRRLLPKKSGLLCVNHFTSWNCLNSGESIAPITIFVLLLCSKKRSQAADKLISITKIETEPPSNSVCPAFTFSILSKLSLRYKSFFESRNNRSFSLPS